MGAEVEENTSGDSREGEKGGLGRHASWMQCNLGQSLNLLNLSFLISKGRVMTFIGQGWQST